MPEEKIALLGLTINYDFSIDFADLKDYHFYFEEKLHVVGELLPVYGNTAKEDIIALEKRMNTILDSTH